MGVFPDNLTTLRRELHAFKPDVVHVHEPPGWSDQLGRALVSRRTDRRDLPRLLDEAVAQPRGDASLGCAASSTRPPARIAVSEAAAWTGRRWFGGEYTVIPNGVDLARRAAGPEARVGAAAAAVRRAARGAQGPAGAAVGVRRAGRARRRRACRSSAPSAPTCCATSPTRSPRSASRRSGASSDDELWRAPPRGRRSLRPLAARRELRHGPHRGVCRRHAGGRLEHRRIRRRRHQRRRRHPRPAGRPAARWPKRFSI